MYWDINKSLSYNALFNFIIGNRGGGKSYGAKKFVINRFLKNKEQFVYIRRYKQELKKIKQFFNDVSNEFPETEFKVKGNTLLINNEIAGYAIPLSTSKIEKSTPFPDVTTIIFDEFILDKGTYRYLQDEITCFLDCYETIARSRDNVRCYFLANAISMTNPYFLYFNVKLPFGKTIQCKNDILIELVQNSEFIENKKKTRFAKIIQNTDYANYSIENTFLRDDYTFVEKKTGKCNFYFALKFNGVIYGVWINYQIGKIYVSYDYDINSINIFAITKDDHEPNTLMLESLRTTRLFKTFLNNYRLGNVYCENINIKNTLYDIIKLAGIR